MGRIKDILKYNVYLSETALSGQNVDFAKTESGEILIGGKLAAAFVQENLGNCSWEIISQNRILVRDVLGENLKKLSEQQAKITEQTRRQIQKITDENSDQIQFGSADPFMVLAKIKAGRKTRELEATRIVMFEIAN
ncbi:MAG: hypothetical protein V2A63_04250 [Patescibacteria group bacterium]